MEMVFQGAFPAGPTLLSLVGPGAEEQEGSARPVFPRGVGGNMFEQKFRVVPPCRALGKKGAVVGSLGYPHLNGGSLLQGQ